MVYEKKKVMGSSSTGIYNCISLYERSHENTTYYFMYLP